MSLFYCTHKLLVHIYTCDYLRCLTVVIWMSWFVGAARNLGVYVTINKSTDNCCWSHPWSGEYRDFQGCQCSWVQPDLMCPYFCGSGQHASLEKGKEGSRSDRSRVGVGGLCFTTRVLWQRLDWLLCPLCTFLDSTHEYPIISLLYLPMTIKNKSSVAAAMVPPRAITAVYLIFLLPSICFSILLFHFNVFSLHILLLSCHMVFAKQNASLILFEFKASFQTHSIWVD